MQIFASRGRLSRPLERSEWVLNSYRSLTDKRGARSALHGGLEVAPKEQAASTRIKRSILTKQFICLATYCLKDSKC